MKIKDLPGLAKNMALKLFDREDLTLKLGSLFLAVVVWFAVSQSLNPVASTTITSVPLTISLERTAAEQNGLRLIAQDVETVSVLISGNQGSVGNLKTADLTATVSLESVTKAGTYPLTIKASGRTRTDFEVVGIIPPTVNITLDRYVTKTFDVTASAPGVKVADNYYRGDPVCSPNVVDISGPETQINKISRCVVGYTGTQTGLVSPYQGTSSSITLYNENGSVISSEGLTFSQTNFTIDIPVFMRKVLPFEIQFTHVPPDPTFPTDEIKYTIDPPEIEVAATNAFLEETAAITLATLVDFQTLDLGTILTLPVALPEGLQNLSGIESVTVTFDTSGFSKRVIEPDRNNLRVMNGPANYSITPVNLGVTPVTFVGKSEIIEALLAQDIVIQLDMSQVEAAKYQAGYFTAPVTIYAPGKGCVWALESYTMAFQAKLTKTTG